MAPVPTSASEKVQVQVCELCQPQVLVRALTPEQISVLCQPSAEQQAPASLPEVPIRPFALC